MVAIKNKGKLQTGTTEVPLVKIPEVLNYIKILRIKIPKKDVFFQWSLPELVAAVSAETLAEIKDQWEERNIIDVEKKYQFPVFLLSDENLEDTLRWHLRGLPVCLAGRKVRTEIIARLDVLEKIKAEIHRLNHTIQGFRIGNRVVLSKQGYCRQNMIGWEGVITAIREDYCLVHFDLDPKELEGGDKKHQVKYEWITPIRKASPKLKEPKKPPILKAAKLEAKIQPPSKEVTKINSKTKQPALSHKEEVKAEVKVKPTIQQLIENLKLFKATNLEMSQDRGGYTATELAEKLNVSRAKIYQMRSNGTLEAAGYRAESQGRSLLFVAID